MNLKIRLLKDVSYSYPQDVDDWDDCSECFAINKGTVLEILKIEKENNHNIASTLTPHGHKIQFILKSGEGASKWFDVIEKECDGI